MLPHDLHWPFLASEQHNMGKVEAVPEISCKTSRPLSKINSVGAVFITLEDVLRITMGQCIENGILLSRTWQFVLKISATGPESSDTLVLDIISSRLGGLEMSLTSSFCNQQPSRSTIATQTYETCLG
ncbi:unnamed protein product [Clonostachys rhizophaga]|uniref:Uncharacterized protein n=1 Tax=Clonostachys rhizophaga TaxID=160324 RepID=A0A9N9VG39_9HYPO|nr:unnamed protein product [Clonostachys rhizophaga]